MSDRASRASGAGFLVVLLVALFTTTTRAGFPSPPPPPLPCSRAPHEAAISFFEFVEKPGGEEALRSSAREVLARSLQPELGRVLDTIGRARAEFSSGRRDPPLSARLTDAPRLLSRNEAGFDPQAQVTVRLEAATARGKVEHRAALSCEKGLWRIVSFAYGPPRR